MSRLRELDILAKQLLQRADTNQNVWAHPPDIIPVTQPDGRRYEWRRINPDSHRNKLKQKKN